VLQLCCSVYLAYKTQKVYCYKIHLFNLYSFTNVLFCLCMLKTAQCVVSCVLLLRMYFYYMFSKNRIPKKNVYLQLRRLSL